MYFMSPDERDAKALFGTITARTFWGEKMLLSLVELPALLPERPGVTAPSPPPQGRPRPIRRG